MQIYGVTLEYLSHSSYDFKLSTQELATGLSYTILVLNRNLN